MHSVATKIAKDVGLKGHIIQALQKPIHTLVFNVCSLAKIIMLLYNARKLTHVHILSMRMYISDKCEPIKRRKTMSGGESMASDFFGYEHPSYSPNAGGSDVLNVNFSAGIARPEISGGDPKIKQLYAKNKEVEDFITEHVNFKDDDVRSEFLDIIESKLRCFIADLKRHKPHTTTQINKILSNEQYFIFH